MNYATLILNFTNSSFDALEQALGIKVNWFNPFEHQANPLLNNFSAKTAKPRTVIKIGTHKIKPMLQVNKIINFLSVHIAHRALRHSYSDDIKPALQIVLLNDKRTINFRALQSHFYQSNHRVQCILASERHDPQMIKLFFKFLFLNSLVVSALSSAKGTDKLTFKFSKI